VEGTIGIDRIIKMLNVWDDKLVVDAKGIYSIEKFLISRRLMYWQVYLHKTVVSAEILLINVLNRAKELTLAGHNVFTTPALEVFFKNKITSGIFKNEKEIHGKSMLAWFSCLDDNDIISSMKEWQEHEDFVLSYLAKSLMQRKLFRIKLKSKQVAESKLEKLVVKISRHFNIEEKLARYFIMYGEITNNAYNKYNENINILFNNEKIKDIREASDINLSVLTKTVRKYYLCFPKELDIY
jgi:HD superfamily phosphohydrolase